MKPKEYQLTFVVYLCKKCKVAHKDILNPFEMDLFIAHCKTGKSRLIKSWPLGNCINN